VKNVLCTTTSFGSASPGVLDRIRAHGLTPVLNPLKRKLTARELEDLVARHDPVGILAGTEPISSRSLAGFPQTVRVISRVGAGWDNVDREAAEKKGIQVFRTQEVLDDAVAELTLGMILAALRRLPRHDSDLKAGTWRKHMGGLLKGKTLGILGFGSIGRQVGTLCHALGARIVYTDPVPFPCDWASPESRETLLSISDIITLHAAGSRVLLDGDDLAACRPGVILVNTARGGMVDETALLKGLVSGAVGFACLDVFEKEPYEGPLRDLDNVLLTPHIGSYAREARAAMEEMAVDHLLAGLGMPPDPITQRS
jgi:D-3-phosphoglycerate dehydrogenase